MAICCSCCSFERLSNACAREEFAICSRTNCSTSIFRVNITKATPAKTPIINHGTHQLALRRISSRVLEGEMNVFVIRCSSESPVEVSVGMGGTVALMRVLELEIYLKMERF